MRVLPLQLTDEVELSGGRVKAADLCQERVPFRSDHLVEDHIGGIGYHNIPKACGRETERLRLFLHTFASRIRADNLVMSVEPWLGSNCMDRRTRDTSGSLSTYHLMWLFRFRSGAHLDTYIHHRIYYPLIRSGESNGIAVRTHIQKLGPGLVRVKPDADAEVIKPDFP